jgi:hypothetical protein
LYKLVACDTDSIKICKQDGSEMTSEEQDLILKLMDESTPDGIKLEPDGYYKRFLVIKSKNYVTDDGNKIKYKGSAVTDQKKEPILVKFIKEVIVALLEDKDIIYILDIYNKYCMEALQPKSINEWCVKKTITKAVLTSDRPNETKVLTACNEAVKASVLNGIQEGDKIYLYQTIDGEKQAMAKGELLYNKDGKPKMVPNKILRVPELYNNDMDSWHYVDRVYKTMKILENILDMKLFPKYALKSNRKKLETLLKKE